LIEMVLVLPFLLIIVFGIVEFGKAVAYWNDETHLANQASRYAAVNSCSACGSTMINSWILSQAETQELANGATLKITFPEQSGGVPAAKNHCTTHAVKVTVTYPYHLLGFLSDKIGLGTIQINASSTQRIEQDWNGAANGTPSANDKYRAESGSPSNDSCAA